MVRESDCVALKEDLPEHRLKRGDIGAVVGASRAEGPYLVEFVAPGGETIALISLERAQVRRAGEGPDERREWRAILDRASASSGFRVKMTDLAELAKGSPIHLDPGRARKNLERLGLVNRMTGKRFRRVFFLQDPSCGQIIIDTKAMPGERRRALRGALHEYGKAFRSLDATIPLYQQKIRDLLHSS